MEYSYMHEKENKFLIFKNIHVMTFFNSNYTRMELKRKANEKKCCISFYSIF